MQIGTHLFRELKLQNLHPRELLFLANHEADSEELFLTPTERMHGNGVPAQWSPYLTLESMAGHCYRQSLCEVPCTPFLIQKGACNWEQRSSVSLHARHQTHGLEPAAQAAQGAVGCWVSPSPDTCQPLAEHCTWHVMHTCHAFFHMSLLKSCVSNYDINNTRRKRHSERIFIEKCRLKVKISLTR